ncbi:MAG: sulfur carrier protein ThiS adenylyltransferase ThiF [Deltaproteobacteria bacterium]|jgi:sulfur carrier protein ThiS adenylyltransferase|nr:sulfur carrier protein ThiS adenylyltransferase ThiF [Deltaproteobacteria bacterium]
MTIHVNEQQQDLLPGDTVGAIRDRVKPQADLLIVNGFPAEPDAVLQHGDHVVLIRRGEIPAADEFEALLTARHTPGVHQHIKHACIGIAGVGGLGSSVAIALARIGVGQLILADFDVVEPSNLNRQQYFIDQIGQPKVYALRTTLMRINPHVHVTACHVRITPKNVGEVFGHASVLVEAFDRADQKAMLVETFATRFPDRPVIVASGLAGAEPANAVITRQIAKNVYLCGDGLTAAAPGVGLMAPRVGVAAHHQANAVLRLLLGENPVDGDPE